MDKIINSEENWEEGRLGLDEEHQVVVDEMVDLQVDTSLGLVEIKFNPVSRRNPRHSCRG